MDKTTIIFAQLKTKLKTKKKMKTNQLLHRPMGQFQVQQRTIDGMFNATDLLRQWNTTNPEKERSLKNFWKSTNLKELMEEVVLNEINSKCVNSTHLKTFDELKEMLSKTSRGKTNGGTWVHPVLFVKFAMYLNPRFEYHVLKFVSDQLLTIRAYSAESYKRMAKNIYELCTEEEKQYIFRNLISDIAKRNNRIIYGKHNNNIKNLIATSAQLDSLDRIQDEISMLIEKGFLKTIQGLLEYLDK